jgi:1-acyl-sn-glycerol-3-phosphate acyltransferase
VPRPRKSLPSRWYGYLRYNLPILIYTVVLAIAAMIAALFDKAARKQHTLARWWSSLILRTLGVHVHVTGREKIDFREAQIFACNHQSLLDIPVAYTNLPAQFRIMAKKELFSSPLIGPWLRSSGQIPIDRESAAASLRSLTEGVKTIRAGLPLFVFPEGGRSPDGRIKPFLGGAFFVAIRAKAKVVPMAIVGNYEMLPIGTLEVHPRDVDVIFGDPIDTSHYTVKQMDELAARVQAEVERMYYSRSEVQPLAAADETLREQEASRR